MLAPCYKRLNPDIFGVVRRESSEKDIWEERTERMLEFFKHQLFPATSIIGLQEFWLEQNYQSIFREEARKHDFEIQTLQTVRLKMRPDAVAFMIHKSFEILDAFEVFLCNVSDRVALLLWVRHRATKENLILANTHLTFPHTDFDRFNQLRQIITVINSIESFAQMHNIPDATRIILGDLNSEENSKVCESIRSNDYVSCLSTAPPDELYTGLSSSAERSFVTHRNHLGEEVAVDHIYIKRGNKNTSQQNISKINDENIDPITSTTNKQEQQSHQQQQPFPSQNKSAIKLFIDKCDIVPKEIPSSRWNYDFTISDHRPIAASLVLGEKEH